MWALGWQNVAPVAARQWPAGQGFTTHNDGSWDFGAIRGESVAFFITQHRAGYTDGNHHVESQRCRDTRDTDRNTWAEVSMRTATYSPSRCQEETSTSSHDLAFCPGRGKRNAKLPGSYAAPPLVNSMSPHRQVPSCMHCRCVRQFPSEQKCGE